jgi:hypothetical protein
MLGRTSGPSCQIIKEVVSSRTAVFFSAVIGAAMVKLVVYVEVTSRHPYHTPTEELRTVRGLVSTTLTITTHQQTSLVLDPEGIIAQTPQPSTVLGQFQPYLIPTGCGGDNPEINSRHGQGIFFLLQNVHTGYGAQSMRLTSCMRSWHAQERLHLFTFTK